VEYLNQPEEQPKKIRKVIKIVRKKKLTDNQPSTSELIQPPPELLPHPLPT
jgi:hypothetical protein